jgi:hypothetical protein
MILVMKIGYSCKYLAMGRSSYSCRRRRKDVVKLSFMKKIDISFDFRGRPYEAVIRVCEKGGVKEFDTTVLDWELERLLYGNQVIREVDGTLQANILVDKKEQTELKLSIASRLSEYLKVPCFVGDSCLVGAH